PGYSFQESSWIVLAPWTASQPGWRWKAMKFNTKALALTSAILWGLAMLVMGVANLIWGNYGQQFLQTMSSVYPGYHATRSIAEVVIGTIYGTVDGLIGGAVFAWLYNQFARPGV
ncbi:MAG: bacteriophage holin, partial [Candidatus Sulfotelmatobacter sp.]